MKLSFTTSGEPWAVYTLSDGTEVKAKVILTNVRRREGEYDEHGNPRYDMAFQSIVHVDAPDHLKLDTRAANVAGAGTA